MGVRRELRDATARRRTRTTDDGGLRAHRRYLRFLRWPFRASPFLVLAQPLMAIADHVTSRFIGDCLVVPVVRVVDGPVHPMPALVAPEVVSTSREIDLATLPRTEVRV